ncbi:AMP-binding protein, partial [Trinickia caryophylli]
EHERHLLLDAWNATDAEFPERSCLHQLFEAQAERAPDAIAVIDGERSCSYGELNARANQLAHHLIQCGVVPDARVAICLQRGLHMVVGLLAILKAGGAYVPLDPGYPPARLAHILRDAAPTMLLVDRHGQHALADALEALQADSS